METKPPSEKPPITRDTLEWRAIKLWLAARIRNYQRQLESTNPLTTPEEHNITRGRIAAYRDFIAAVEPESAPQDVEAGREVLGFGENLDYDV